jgi:hypothetical protein
MYSSGMADGGNGAQPKKTGAAAKGNSLWNWMSTGTQIFAYGWTLAIPLIAFLWTIVILIYALALPGGVRWGVFATAVIVGSCSFLAGGLVGLLFGIPRSAVSAATAGGGKYQANSNLVEVSDWLTKIIVGVGLVQIGRLEPALSRLAANLKAPLGGQPTSAAFGVALALANVLLGFLFFYLWARSLLQRDLELSDGIAPDDGDAVAVAAAAVPGAHTVVAVESEPAAVADQAPVEQAPVEQAPPQQPPAEQAPPQQAPAEQAPAEQALPAAQPE